MDTGARTMGDRAATGRTLRAIQLSDTGEVALHAAAARHHLGSLLGGEAEADLVEVAEPAIKTREYAFRLATRRCSFLAANGTHRHEDRGGPTNPRRPLVRMLNRMGVL